MSPWRWAAPVLVGVASAALWWSVREGARSVGASERGAVSDGVWCYRAEQVVEGQRWTRWARVEVVAGRLSGVVLAEAEASHPRWFMLGGTVDGPGANVQIDDVYRRDEPGVDPVLRVVGLSRVALEVPEPGRWWGGLVAAPCEEVGRTIGQHELRQRTLENAAKAVGWVDVPAGQVDGRVVGPLQVSPREASQGLWSYALGEHRSRDRGEARPVTGVTWLEAVQLANALSTTLGEEPAYKLTNDRVVWRRGSGGVRLPTRDEWLWLATAGGEPVSSELSRASQHAWVAGHNDEGMTWPVGSKAPTGVGLYDVRGNAWEWVWDGPGERKEGAVDGVGWLCGVDALDLRVCREVGRAVEVERAGVRLVRSGRR